ncbi:MAG: thioredoxin domain-containing protein [bacterium TMED217]|nr:MAG: thioredoxin domain-containing protein [bacterium TMED217]
MNRLADSKSPYLLQHKNNPVDWFPWSVEAFEKAKEENKPIFLSIGYSTCHWCHVMEHESFEDQQVAELMNENFISIKVDREEMPEIDHLYMSVCQAMTGRGGWPLTIVMSPEKEPFFAGTYFPKTGRGNRPGMLELIPSLMNAWNNKQEDIQKTIEQVNNYLDNANNIQPGSALNKKTIDDAYNNFIERYDKNFGGFGKAPKFPSPHNLLFLLRYHKAYQDTMAKTMVENTLSKMRLGGIFDHIGFGFHRYSTDQEWFLPHFEKMLYDQAMISLAYLEAFEISKKQEYASIAHEIFSYVARDMTDENGGFYSAEDADSEGEEGKFYVWSTSEIDKILGPVQGKQFTDVYGFNDNGNFHDEATGQLVPNNIPYLKNRIIDYSVKNNIDIKSLKVTLEKNRNTLFEYRRNRIHPLKDDKILTDWNGLMIAALAKGGTVLKEDKYTNAAERSANFILDNLRDENGRLYKRYRNGSTGLQPHIDDYAFFIWGLLNLYESNFNTYYLKSALELSEIMVADFLDKKRGGFFIGPNNGEKLIVRAKDSYDGAIPSGNAVAAMNFIRISKFTGDSKWEDIAQNTFLAFSESIKRIPSAHSFMLTSFMYGLDNPKEIVIVAKEKNAKTMSSIRKIQEVYNPNSIIIFKELKNRTELDNIAPWTTMHDTVNDQITYYICENFSCRRPTTDIDIAIKYLQ